MYLVSRYYDVKTQRNFDNKGTWLLSKRKTHFNYGFIGSSRVYNMVAIEKTDSVLQPLKGINMGIGGAAFAENLLVLKKYIENGNSLDYLVIQTDLNGVIDPSTAYVQPFSIQNYLYLVGDPSVDSLICSNTGFLIHQFRKYIPYFKYAEFNNLYPLDQVLSQFIPTHPSYELTKGSELLNRKPKKTDRFGIEDETGIIPTNSKAINDLKALVKLADRNNIETVFFTAPVLASYKKVRASEKIAKDSLHKIATLNNIHYFDFEKHAICENEDLFADETHLLANGAKYFSMLLADSLKIVFKK